VAERAQAKQKVLPDERAMPGAVNENEGTVCSIVGNLYPDCDVVSGHASFAAYRLAASVFGFSSISVMRRVIHPLFRAIPPTLAG
jgi:hypothetical protein